jgi:phage terminase large subunit-like protein
LKLAREIRDGKFRGIAVRPMLPVLYEFPRDIAVDRSKWEDPQNWPMVMPNLGRSVHLSDLEPDWNAERLKGEHAVRVWASQHLNIQIGQAMRSDGWAGAAIWDRGIDRAMKLDAILDRSEVCTIGVDGGGLDDLLGVGLIGRERGSKQWLGWAHGLISTIGVLRRKANATEYLKFLQAGDLTVFRFGEPTDEERAADGAAADLIGAAKELPAAPGERWPADIRFILDLVERVRSRGLLALVGVDAAGIGAVVDALAEIGVTQDAENLDPVKQGIALMGAIKTIERKLADRSFRHAGSDLLSWCAGNLKVVPTPTAMRVARDEAGFGKVDPIMALFNAAHHMSLNPGGAQTTYLDTERLILL